MGRANAKNLFSRVYSLKTRKLVGRKNEDGITLSQWEMDQKT
jgi:hypothetical protein